MRYKSFMPKMDETYIQHDKKNIDEYSKRALF